MKTTVIVRKVSTDAILEILLEMKELGVDYVNLECVMTATKDHVHITEYSPKIDPAQQVIDLESTEEERLNYIQKIINRDGSNN